MLSNLAFNLVSMVSILLFNASILSFIVVFVVAKALEMSKFGKLVTKAVSCCKPWFMLVKIGLFMLSWRK